MAYQTPENLIEEFRHDWEAALCPEVSDFLARCHPERKDEFVDLLDLYLQDAPQPPYSPVQSRRMLEKARPMLDTAMKRSGVDEWIEQGAREFDALPWYTQAWRRGRFAGFVWTLKIRSRFNRWFKRQPWE